MAAAQQMLGIVLDGTVGNDPKRQGDILRRIDRALEQSQDMVKNYLDMTRMERGELEAHMSEIDLFTEVIEPVVEQNRQPYESKKISLALPGPEDFGPNGIKITADPELLKIAVTNFVNNAAKYGKKNQTITISTVLNGKDWIKIIVEDQGKGIPKDMQKAIFEKFSQIEPSLSRSREGTGLGLYICKLISEKLGGNIGVCSSAKTGTRFYVDLPLRSIYKE